MPFGQQDASFYSPAKTEYLVGGPVAGYQKTQDRFLSALVRICRAQAGGEKDF
jgi:hypothetical protein